MSSFESEKIRMQFRQMDNPIEIPLEIQRKEWEMDALNANLPSGTIIEPVMMGNLPGEYVGFSGVSSSQVILYFHGGGYTSGSCITHRKLAARIAAQTNMKLLLANYRLAPENPFPAALEDAQKAYFWLLEQETKPKNIILGGDSSGGGLVVSLLLWLRDNGIDLPNSAFLLSPWLDLSLAGESMLTRNNADPLITKEDLCITANRYCNGMDLINPYISPVYGDLKSLPSLLIQVGDHEILLSDSIRLAEKAQESGVQVNLHIYSEMWHVWQAWTELPEADEAIREISWFVSSEKKED